MSEVNTSDHAEIKDKNDVFALYTGAGDQAKAGMEVELAFFNPDDPGYAVMSLCQNRVLKNSAMAAMPGEDWVHNEPTSELLEVASKADVFSGIRSVLDDANMKVKILSDKALGLGLKRSYFQELPDKTAADLLSRIVDVERYQVMYAPYRADMKECVEYFAVCKSNQVSVGYKNMDHLLENVRRLYILAPFLFLLTDNSTGFSEGKPFNGHAGMYLRHRGLLQGRGGVPPYVFTAQSGEEFVACHIDHVMNNPLFMYYDLDGVLHGVPSGDWGVTFNTLRERGLNTTTNYYQAQSILWPDVKIATLKDDQGVVNGHRYEARMFGVGVHQHQTAFILTSALAFHEQFASSVDALLERFGFGCDAQDTYDRVLQAYAHARDHDGAFFDIPYGTGAMTDFAKDFADLVEVMSEDTGLEREIQPILTICRTGYTDAKVNRLLFPALSDVMDFQKTYDPRIFDRPDLCARDIFDKEIVRHDDSSCVVVPRA